MKILLFEGGKSTEHEVSLESASYIRENLEKLGHEVKTVRITKQGRFIYRSKEVCFSPTNGFFTDEGILDADVAFPVMHGYSGEDGMIQSLLCFSGLPYVSETPLTSALGMHKASQNRLLDGLVPLLPYLEVPMRRVSLSLAETLIDDLGCCLVTKPEDGGSSVGVIAERCFKPDTLLKAIEESGVYSESVIVQRYLPHVRELEIFAYADYENKQIRILSPVEIVTGAKLLDYKSKYSSGSTVLSGDQVKLTDEERADLKEYAERVFRALSGTMYMRIDFFLQDGEIFFNEVNTIPGMTANSHAPRAIAAESSICEVLTTLLDNAIRRQKSEEMIKRSYD